MALNLIKLCVGIETVEHLAEVQKKRRKGRQKYNYHFTRMMPQRGEEIVEQGSLYWVIKGFVRVRQRIVALDSVHVEDEGKFCRISLDPTHVLVEPTPFRAFQGWRYLEPKAAPRDVKGKLGGKRGLAAMPPELLAELKQLGLI